MLFAIPNTPFFQLPLALPDNGIPQYIDGNVLHFEMDGRDCSMDLLYCEGTVGRIREARLSPPRHDGAAEIRFFEPDPNGDCAITDLYFEPGGGYYWLVARVQRP